MFESGKPIGGEMVQVDWLHPAIIDAMWERLCTLEHIATTIGRQPDAILHVYRVVCTLCRTLHGRMRERLWTQIHRPYLIGTAHAHNNARHELSLRCLVAGMQRGAMLWNVKHMTVVGNFAAWQLERALETHRGNKAFPFVERASTHKSGFPKGTVWVPAEMSVYVGCDDEQRVLDVVTCPYLRYLEHTSWTSSRVIRFVTRRLKTRFEDLSDQMSASEVKRLLTRHGYPEDVITACTLHHREHEEIAPYSFENFIHGIVKIMPVDANDALCPIQLNVIRTSPPPANVEYDAWIREHINLRHCAIGIDVHPQTLQWNFSCTEEARCALMHRRIAFSRDAFSTMEQARRTMHSVGKYLFLGFSIPGDQHWPDDAEKHRVCKRVHVQLSAGG